MCPPDTEPQAVASYPVTVVDSIGAGDAQCSGLLAGLAACWLLAQAVDLSNRVAACMVAVQGSSQPPDWNTLDEYFPHAAPQPIFPTC
nr:PfkB family carbohydrate kinase [Candidatus Symbiopectobacterium sp.]